MGVLLQSRVGKHAYFYSLRCFAVRVVLINVLRDDRN